MMVTEEVVEKAKMFQDKGVSQAYITVSFLADWQKQTGGKLEDLLVWMEQNCAKRKR